MSNIVKEIEFYNSTELPVMVDAWIDDSTSLHSSRIDAGEKIILYSSIGEWHIHSMFTDTEDRKLWVENGLGKYLLIGKFRSKPCASGNYTWMEWDDIFACEYKEYHVEGELKRIVTLIQNEV